MLFHVTLTQYLQRTEALLDISFFGWQFGWEEGHAACKKIHLLSRANPGSPGGWPLDWWMCVDCWVVELTLRSIGWRLKKPTAMMRSERALTTPPMKTWTRHRPYVSSRSHQWSVNSMRTWTSHPVMVSLSCRHCMEEDYLNCSVSCSSKLAVESWLTTLLIVVKSNGAACNHVFLTY